MILDIDATTVYERTISADTRIVCNIGGSRSSKSTSTAQAFVTKLVSETGKIFTVSRKTGPALTASAQEDVISILRDKGLYNEEDHHKAERTIRFNGNLLRFLSVDQSTKLKSLKHNYIWMNEADEFTYEDFLQFNLRLSAPSIDGRKNQIYLDYNPPDPEHWIVREIHSRPSTDVTIIESSYLDNGFLDEDTVAEIERLRFSDPEAFARYGLGQIVAKRERIYPEFRTIANFPEVPYVYGLDFGYNHPLALTRVAYIDGLGIYWEEVIYKRGLSTGDMLEAFREAGVEKNITIAADPARPDLISELKKAGYRVEPAFNKVYEGILRVKSSPLHITEGSINLIKEAKAYQWKKTKDGALLDEPVKFMDDGVDSGRYGTALLVGSSKIIKPPPLKLIKRR